MATPKIVAYTADISICSQICRLAIHEHQLPCEHVNVDIEAAMENCEPWFARIQPKMTVPCMKYDETILGDSKDICYFLAQRHPEAGLYPADASTRAAIDEYIDAFYSRFGLIAAFTFGNLVRKSPDVKAFIAKGKNETSIAKLKKLMEEPDLKELAAAKLAQKTRFDMVAWAESQDVAMLDLKMSELLTQMENSLADERPFLMGDEYTLADVVGTAFCARVHMIRQETLFGAKVASWWKRMKERPSFREAYICSVWDESLMAKQCIVFVDGGDPLSVKFVRPGASL